METEIKKKITEMLADEMQDVCKAVLEDVAWVKPIFGVSALFVSALTLCKGNCLDPQRIFDDVMWAFTKAQEEDEDEK